MNTLREHLNGLSERTPRLSVDAVRVGRRPDIRARLVHLRVDDETRRVDDGLITALDNVPVRIDEDQVRRLHGGEVLREGVEPEVVRQHGILPAIALA